MNALVTFCCCFAIFLMGCNAKRQSPISQRCEIFATQYAEQMQGLSSSLRITTRELQKWDEIVRKLPLLKEGGTYLLYTYLYCSQKAFADRSFALTGEYRGSLDAVSLQVIRLFYPNFEAHSVKTDPFSQKLTKLVMIDVEKRFQSEQKQMYDIPISKRENDWKGENPAGLHYPTLKPWALRSVDEFQTPSPPPPDSPVWKDELKQTKQQLQSATEDQKLRSRFWQRLVDPEAADWRFITVQYLNEKIDSLEMQLEVRSKIMMALIDALIAVFHDKYMYMVKRPFMRDSQLKPLFPTPNHPSYPAAHGTMAGAAEMILMYYFPENGKKWKHLASEAGESRLWGGIHFPIDIEAGHKQGQQVGKAVLFRNQIEL